MMLKTSRQRGFVTGNCVNGEKARAPSRHQRRSRQNPKWEAVTDESTHSEKVSGEMNQEDNKVAAAAADQKNSTIRTSANRKSSKVTSSSCQEMGWKKSSKGALANSTSPAHTKGRGGVVTRRSSGPAIRYPVGTKVKVKCGSGHLQIYEAKVISVSIVDDRVPHYFVHYCGWNKNHDAWISQKDIVSVIERPTTAEGVAAPKEGVTKVSAKISSGQGKFRRNSRKFERKKRDSEALGSTTKTVQWKRKVQTPVETKEEEQKIKEEEEEGDCREVKRQRIGSSADGSVATEAGEMREETGTSLEEKREEDEEDDTGGSIEEMDELVSKVSYSSLIESSLSATDEERNSAVDEGCEGDDEGNTESSKDDNGETVAAGEAMEDDSRTKEDVAVTAADDSQALSYLVEDSFAQNDVLMVCDDLKRLPFNPPTVDMKGTDVENVEAEQKDAERGLVKQETSSISDRIVDNPDAKEINEKTAESLLLDELSDSDASLIEPVFGCETDCVEPASDIFVRLEDDEVSDDTSSVSNQDMPPSLLSNSEEACNDLEAENESIRSGDTGSLSSCRILCSTSSGSSHCVSGTTRHFAGVAEVTSSASSSNQSYNVSHSSRLSAKAPRIDFLDFDVLAGKSADERIELIMNRLNQMKNLYQSYVSELKRIESCTNKRKKPRRSRLHRHANTTVAVAAMTTDASSLF